MTTLTQTRMLPGRPRVGAVAGRRLLAGVEQRLGLTPAGLTVVACVVAMWVVGRLIPKRGLVLVAYGLALLVIVSWVLGRRRLAIDAERSTPPTRLPAGRSFDVELALTARRRITSIVVEEEVDRGLGTPVRVAVPLLPGGQTMSHTYSLTPAVRGVYKVGPLVAEFSDPFGLTRRRQQIAPDCKLIVHPSTEPVTDRITNREWEDPPVRPPFSRPWPSGFEFYGMRDYVPGDDPRRIVWRALAQHDEYLVKEAEQGITDRVHIYLDTDRSGHSPGQPSSTFELAVRVAASLAKKHLSDGFSVSLDTNEGRLANAYRGRGRLIPLLDQLAAVNRGRTTFTAAVDRLFLDQQRNAHNVLVTPHLTQSAAARLRLLLERGTSMLLVLVVWDDTDPMTLHRASGLRCNVVEVRAQTPLATVFGRLVEAGRR